MDDFEARLDALAEGYAAIRVECDRMLVTLAETDALIASWQAPDLAAAA